MDMASEEVDEEQEIFGTTAREDELLKDVP